MTAPMRALLGYAAAVVSVLPFHQGMWALLHVAGLIPPAPYPTGPVPPLGVPRVANFAFWGGLVRRRLRARAAEAATGADVAAGARARPARHLRA
jgi:hypothetical protein